jgi:hypothetical protein
MSMRSEVPNDEHAEKRGRVGDNLDVIGRDGGDGADVIYVENDDILEPMEPPLDGDVEDHVWVDEFGDSFVAEVGGAPLQARVGDAEPEG